MRIEILAVDRLRSDWARMAMAEYLERTRRFSGIDRREIKAARGGDSRAVEEEGKRLLKAAARGPRDQLVALSPAGESIDSEGWAALFAEWMEHRVNRVVFAVGGVGGLSLVVLEEADRTLALGPHTLSHELAQIVLVEQIYRAWTIMAGEPYHK
ncbi:MAG TPA: 23S rRNA (pseudouridine(1915)-N(3))-methyltransferase RlmH [Gemmatimonadota bacterium]|nr:23S rRNA (pseudouridine(1915)-N(3))-methyltransferase RlmH [Gemmatimonadota bacterium]